MPIMARIEHLWRPARRIGLRLFLLAMAAFALFLSFR